MLISKRNLLKTLLRRQLDEELNKLIFNKINNIKPKSTFRKIEESIENEEKRKKNSKTQ